MTTADQITGIHPYADKFPMLPPDEIKVIADTIRTVGQLHPIVVDSQGLILDGRNRFAACQQAEVEPAVEVYEGDDPAEYVIAANVIRRNMSTGARAMATALVLEAAGRRVDGRWKYGAMREMLDSQQLSSSTWRGLLNQCGIVLDWAPHHAEAVVRGEMTLNAAYAEAEQARKTEDHAKIQERERKRREAQEAKEEAERNAKIVADLTQAGQQNYLDLITAGTMTPKAAWAAYREDTRKERERVEAKRKAMSQMYSGIAKANITFSGYGADPNIETLMADYNPDELHPPELREYMTVEKWRAAVNFAQEMVRLFEEGKLK